MGILRHAGRAIRRALRVAASSLCFQTFFYGGVLVAAVAAPLARLSTRDEAKARARFLSLVSFLFRLFMFQMVALRMLDSFEVRGARPWKDRPCLVVANHPTLVDIVALFSALPRAGCIVKGELLRHPFFGGVVRAAGYIPNDSGPEMIEGARRHFDEGFSLVVFPEGSRSLAEGLRPFHRGAARIALECDVPVVPVRIAAEPGFLRRGDRWYQIPDEPVVFRLEFQDPIGIPPEIRDDPVPSRRVRRLTDLFQARIEEISGQRVVEAPVPETAARG